MLKYIEVCLSNIEVPNESSICIYISGCLNKCSECHYPELQNPLYGDFLQENYDKIISIYRKRATCVCFLGEGENTIESRNELIVYANKANLLGLKSCLYCGRDIEIEDWMNVFDFIKIGSYQKQFGSLYNKTTNQKFYKKTESGYIDITDKFWLV